ncbi:MAG TPA: ABC transporter permease [Candidatus Saccharimonadia bacterium]|nr:ABC transporter permease [Candidatus Saccharimonadia bacterium]
MNFRIIYALVLRYIFLYARTPMRLIELIFWPVVDLMVWGNLTLFLQKNSDKDFAKYLVFLIGGMILWDVLFRAQQGVAISFLEDVWTRNLLNIFVAPVRVVEYVGATFVIGFLRICVTMVVLCSLAAVGYGFNVFRLEWSLIPFFINLLVFGWALGMISTALILRWGQAVESLAWAVPFFIQPIVAVFYPVEDLPAWVRPIAWCFPATHIFEGMRAVLDTKITEFPWGHIGWAVVLNIIFLAIAGTIFGTMLMQTKKRGLLTKFATQ